MQDFTVTARNSAAPAGAVLALTPDQADRRAHAITLVEAAGVAPMVKGASAADIDRFTGDRILVRLEENMFFKLGETFGVVVGASLMNKRSMTEVAPSNSPAAKQARGAARKRKAEADAKAKAQSQTARETEARRAEIKKMGKGKKPAPKATSTKPAGTVKTETAKAAKAGKTASTRRAV